MAGPAHTWNSGIHSISSLPHRTDRAARRRGAWLLSARDIQLTKLANLPSKLSAMSRDSSSSTGFFFRRKSLLELHQVSSRAGVAETPADRKRSSTCRRARLPWQPDAASRGILLAVSVPSVCVAGIRGEKRPSGPNSTIVRFLVFFSY